MSEIEYVHSSNISKASKNESLAAYWTSSIDIQFPVITTGLQDGPATLKVAGVKADANGKAVVRLTVDDELTGADQLTVDFDKKLFTGADVALDKDTLTVTLH